MSRVESKNGEGKIRPLKESAGPKKKKRRPQAPTPGGHRLLLSGKRDDSVGEGPKKRERGTFKKPCASRGAGRQATNSCAIGGKLEVAKLNQGRIFERKSEVTNVDP